MSTRTYIVEADRGGKVYTLSGNPQGSDDPVVLYMDEDDAETIAKALNNAYGDFGLQARESNQ